MLNLHVYKHLQSSSVLRELTATQQRLLHVRPKILGNCESVAHLRKHLESESRLKYYGLCLAF